MLSLYHPGDSLLHRARAGLKLAVLCLGGTLAMFTANPWALGAALAVLAGLYALARVPARLAWRLTRHLLVFVVIVAGLQWACASAELAALVGLRLALLIGGATLLTLTTRTSALIDTVEWLCRPLRVFGVQPDRIGVAVSLTLRFIPVIGDKASAIRQAQAARGVRTFRSFLVPLLVATLRAADGVGEALDGRGLESRPPSTERLPDRRTPPNHGGVHRSGERSMIGARHA